MAFLLSENAVFTVPFPAFFPRWGGRFSGRNVYKTALLTYEKGDFPL